MSRALLAAAALFAAPVLSGCGTFANLSLGARQGWKNALIYGGVRRDVQSAGNWIDHSWTWGPNLDIQQDLGTVVGVGLVGLDVPLSAIGDTLTLPITIPATIWGGNGTKPSVSSKNQVAPVPPNPSPTVAQPVSPSEPPSPNNRSRSSAPSGRKAPDGSSPSS
jgi:uncharacterized protein YceK